MAQLSTLESTQVGFLDRAAAAAFDLVRVDDDAAARRDKLAGFTLLLQIHLTVSLSLWGWTQLEDARRWLFAPLCIATAWVATRTNVRSALCITGLGVLLEATSTPLMLAPGVLANHNAVEYACLAILLLVNPELEDERELGLRAMRWLLVIVFFYSGLQKAWHGAYFGGEFFAWTLSTGRWVDTVGRLVTADELQRLLAYSKLNVHFDRATMLDPIPGPYRVESPWLALASNSVWISEIVASLSLLSRRFRYLAIPFALLIFLGIELIVHELFFGALMAGLVLLFARRSYFYKAMPIFIAIYAFIAAATLKMIDVEIPR